MIKGLVTVVLPIYNVEQYLDRCINSVVNQTYKNLEIILVDDESPDNCPKMCDEWAKMDSRIKVIHKKNQGLGYARNTGIDSATGEYIYFVDSDDYIAMDTIELAYKAAAENNADMVTFGYNQVDSNGNIQKSYIPKPQKNIYEYAEVQNEFLADMIAPDTKSGKASNLWMSMCGALFSMELIQKHNWRLVSEREIISEDVYSLLKLYKYVNKVIVLSKAFYFYCENPTSLTHTYRIDRFEKIKHFYLECKILCSKYNYNDAIYDRLNYIYLSYIIAAFKMIVRSDNSKLEKKQILKDIIDDSLTQDVLKQTVLKKEKSFRKIFLTLLKYKKYNLCYLLLLLKTRGD